MKVHTGHADEAIPLFKSALDRQPDDQSRQDCIAGFLKAMAKHGKLADGYAAVPDSRENFRSAAAQGLAAYRLEDVKRIAAVHRKNDPADPLLAWYLGVVQTREGRYALADRTFYDRPGAPPDDPTLATFRADRVTARYHTAHHTLAAYRDIGPRDETFKQLALAAEERRGGRPAATIARRPREKRSAESRSAPLSLPVEDQEGKIDEGIALFQAGLKRPLTDKEQEQWVREFLGEMTEAGKAVEGYQAAAAQGRVSILVEDMWDEEREEDRHDALRWSKPIASAPRMTRGWPTIRAKSTWRTRPGTRQPTACGRA